DQQQRLCLGPKRVKTSRHQQGRSGRYSFFFFNHIAYLAQTKISWRRQASFSPNPNQTCSSTTQTTFAPKNDTREFSCCYSLGRGRNYSPGNSPWSDRISRTALFYARSTLQASGCYSARASHIQATAEG